MPAVYKGHLRHKDETYEIRAILGKDIKINIYKSSKESQDINSLLRYGSQQVNNLMGGPKYEIVGSYINYTVKDKENKKLRRKTFLHGDVSYAHKVLELYNQSYLPEEETRNESYPSHLGIVHALSYKKQLINSTIKGNIEEVNGIVNEVKIVQTFENEEYELELNKTNKGEKVKLTEGLDYSESIFDIGKIRDNAIHTQIRSIAHLRSIKNLDWIDEKIESGEFRIVDKLEGPNGLKSVVNEVLEDLKRINEKKLYYDTEGSGLKVFNLPPDHEEFDILCTHVITWVTERRESDGFPLKSKTIAVPVGMKYCENADEIEAIKILEPLLRNPEIGVVSHNSDYEKQINLRYSEVENELSYRKYYKWKNEIQSNDSSVDKAYIEKRIETLSKQLEEEQKNAKGLMARLKTAPLKKEIDELKGKLDADAELERVSNLPKLEKPYVSDIKGEDIFRVNIKYDTLVLSRMVNNGANKKDGTPFLRHDLKTLSKEYLGIEQLSLDDVFGNSQSSKYKIYDFSILPREYMYYYACPDTYVMPEIEWHLERQAYNHMIEMGGNESKAVQANIELLKLYYEVDTPFALHMSEFANYKGIAIDKEKLDRDRDMYKEGVELILDFLTEITGEEDIKWSSTKQVAPLIFGKYRYPAIFTTDTGEKSYNKKTRQFHINQKKDKYEAVYENVVDIPEMEKDLKDSQGNVILKKDIINELKCPLSYIYQKYMDRYKDLTSFTKMIYERTYYIDGQWIYFPSYISTSTDTGRASGGTMIMKSSKKSTFIARKGHKLCGGDLDQAELRLIATMAQDLEDIQNFKDPRYDPHTKTGSDISNKPMNEVSKDDRGAAKVINFGYFYGMGEKSCAENIHKDKVPVPKPLVLQVKLLLVEFARKNRVKVAWLNNLRESVKKLGYSKTPMGRYKWFPETRKEDVEHWELARAGRQGGNVPIQGLCADYIKQRIVKLFDIVKDCGISRYFTQPLFIHDEFHAEIAEEAFKYASNDVYNKERVKREQQFNLLWWYEQIYSIFTETPLGFSYLEDEAPMTLGIGLGNNWDESKSDLHGCPQELQKVLIQEYREGRVDDEFHRALSTAPREAMLNRIRKWWAEELVKEIEKVTTLDNIPKDIMNRIEDLFIKRNLKDIFPVEEEDLVKLKIIEEGDIPNKNDFGLGQVMKALRFLDGEKVTFVDVLKDDKIDIQEDGELVDNIIESEIIDLDVYRKLKEDITSEYEDLNDYDFVFKESNIMEFGKFMVHEQNKVLEINIDGLMSDIVVDLEKLISNHHVEYGNYGVTVVAQKPDSPYPYKTYNTTYRVNVNEDLLLKIKSLFKKNEEKELEYYKRMA